MALKFIIGGNPQLAQRFMQEARAQSRIEHANVCRVYEVGEVKQQAYIAMAYIEGQSLEAAARDLTLPQKVQVIRDAALGLHEAHRLGIIHREL